MVILLLQILDIYFVTNKKVIKLKSFLEKHESGPVVLFSDIGQDKEGSCWYQLLLQHLLTFIFLASFS